MNPWALVPIAVAVLVLYVLVTYFDPYQSLKDLHE